MFPAVSCNLLRVHKGSFQVSDDTDSLGKSLLSHFHKMLVAFLSCLILRLLLSQFLLLVAKLFFNLQ